jgi:catechol 2,3-dioxygenase-like lactoylglutathione lyase family enzyme
MIESISAITLATHNMSRAVRFYRTLGFEIVSWCHSRALQLREGLERQRGWRSLWWNRSLQLVD